MPLIHVHLLAGRSQEQKTAFARALTQAAAEHLNAPASAVRVLFHETAPEHWFTAGEPKQAPRPSE